MREISTRIIIGRTSVLSLLRVIITVVLTLTGTVIIGAPPRNSVVLFVDDFGWADFAHRCEDLPTPNLDQLRADGVTFKNAYAASPTCSPSRASMVTGRHPARFRLVRHVAHGRKFSSAWHQYPTDPAKMASRNWLPHTEDTYADSLSNAGVRCVFVGKWHLGPEPYFPIHHGFDEQYGVTEHGHPRNYYPPYFPAKTTQYADTPSDTYLTDRVTDDAVAVIREHDQKRPLHLSTFFYGVHSPLIGKKEYVETLQQTGLSGDELQFAAMTLSIDEAVGRIRSALNTAGMSENTLIVFAGDQGGPLDNSPYEGGKMHNTLGEGGARIPLVIVEPTSEAKGYETNSPVSTLDVLPTLLESHGLEPTKEKDGISLLSFAKGFQADIDQSRPLFLYRSYEDQYAAVRIGKWKLIAYRSEKIKLFDLVADPFEATDLAASHRKRSGEMLTILRDWEQEIGIALPSPK